MSFLPMPPGPAMRGPLDFPRPQFDVPDEVNQAAAMPVRKRGIFGQGSFLRHLAGGLADGLAANAGMQPGFAAALQQQRAMEMYKRQQADELAQYERKQQIEAQYRKQTPYRWESNNGSLMEIGEDGQPRLVYQDPTPKINWVRADNGDGTFTMVPMSQGGPVSQIPTAPVGELRPYGGPTATPSGGFR